MNGIRTQNLDKLAEEIFSRLTLEIEASGRHVHLSRADLDALFGPGYRLTPVKDLSQPGQFACAERVTLEGPGAASATWSSWAPNGGRARWRSPSPTR